MRAINDKVSEILSFINGYKAEAAFYKVLKDDGVNECRSDELPHIANGRETIPIEEVIKFWEDTGKSIEAELTEFIDKLVEKNNF